MSLFLRTVILCLCQKLRIPWLLVCMLSCQIILGKGKNDTAQSFLEQAKIESDRGNFIRALAFLDTSYTLAFERNQRMELVQIQSQRGTLFHGRGDYNEALTYYFKALTIYESMDSISDLTLAELLNNIGSIHHYQGNFKEAERYYKRCLELLLKGGDSKSLGKSFNNYGTLYEDMGRPIEALEQHNKGLQIWKELKDTSWMAISFANIGSCMELTGQLDSALTLYQTSLAYLEKLPESMRNGFIMRMIGDVYLLMGSPEKAVMWCEKARAEGYRWEAVQLLKESCNCLYRAYQLKGDPSRALAMHEDFILYRDSLSGNDLVRQITKLEMDYSFKKKQLADSIATAQSKMEAQFTFDTQLAKEKTKRIFSYIMGIAILVIAAGLWSRLTYIRKSRAEIQAEREKSDGLLLNILPASVALELKSTGKAQARHFERVTVLFTDFLDFTGIAETLTAEELLEELNICFKTFDQIILDHGLEKIKTIGDAYMAVAGLGESSVKTSLQAVKAGLALQTFIKARRNTRELEGLRAFEMRVGIHSGPVVAGVVGRTKFQYDIWGDTVNIAARMEEYGQIDEVNISRTTYELLKKESEFQFLERELIDVKGKGEMKMYWVRRSVQADEANRPSKKAENG